MDCNVIKDLLPLYADGVCSNESRELIEAHLAQCEECRRDLERMQTQITEQGAALPKPIVKKKKVHLWIASVMQSVLMLVSFFILTIGVALEARTPYGFANGLFAFTLVLPATGYMLSLANWYFIRLYRSRAVFVFSSVIITAMITASVYLWGLWYYEYFVTLTSAQFALYFYGPGIAFSFFLCLLSGFFSNLYANLIGKE